MFGIQCSQHVYDWLVLISFYNGPPAYPVSLVFFLRSSSQYPLQTHPSASPVLGRNCVYRSTVQGHSALRFQPLLSAYHIPYHTQGRNVGHDGVPHTGLDALAQSRCHDRGVCCVCVSALVPLAARLSRRIAHCFANRFVVQEYDKCYNLVRECSPHARIAYDCTSIESFRESAVHDPIPRIHLSPPLPASVRRSRWYMQARSYHKCCRSS